ncbi:hypothetical protein RhiirA4_482083 [Rhizophagus irregularis]|uniref:Uncharacterized protein n=1 Tax=Rhizophagus irregularis TaxID=588596 RepID=A0A2I1HKI8_9GLOM|nr:hypothetical protein RhiirA4_482083 [Rhizophagus irregularis]
MDKSRISNKAAVDFVSKFNEIYFRSISYHLGSFVEDGFLKEQPISTSFYAASKSWDNFSSQFLTKFGDISVLTDEDVDDMFDESSVDEPDEDEDLGISR